jgi:nitroreductase
MFASLLKPYGPGSASGLFCFAVLLYERRRLPRIASVRSPPGDRLMEETGVYEAMSTLRAVRRLRSDPLPDEVLERVLEAATWAPTGGNLQPWRAIVLRDPELKAATGRLYADCWQRYVGGHRAAIEGLGAELKASQERMLAAGDYLAEHWADSPAIVVFCFNPEAMAITDRALDRVSVVGGASVYPAVENLLLACRAEGLGCVLTTLLCEVEEELRALLGFPGPWGVAAAVPLGYPLLGGHGSISRRPVTKMFFADSWGKAW